MTTLTHVFPVRVYYEDTDHGGVVYHANYLKYMERGRTEFLRTGGLELDAVERQYGCLFTVTKVELRFLAPARFNDSLEVESRLIELSGARLAFAQCVRRDNLILVTGVIGLACIDRGSGRPRRIPTPIRHTLAAELSKEDVHER